MQISRIATIVAAGAMAPALFLTTPAVADDKSATSTVPAAVVAPSKGELPVLSVESFPGTFKAGDTDWTHLKVKVDNSKGDDADVTIPFTIDFEHTLKSGDIEKQFWTAERNDWVGSASGDSRVGAGEIKVGKGGTAVLDFRIRFAAGAPAGKGTFKMRTIVSTIDLPSTEIRLAVPFSVTAAPKPSPSASSNTGTGTGTGKASPSASASKAPSTQPSKQPSASASSPAKPSASASAKPTASQSAAGTATGSGTTPKGGGTELASTGSDPKTPYIAAAGVAALVAGAGMVFAARRRANARG